MGREASFYRLPGLVDHIGRTSIMPHPGTRAFYDSLYFETGAEGGGVQVGERDSNRGAGCQGGEGVPVGQGGIEGARWQFQGAGFNHPPPPYPRSPHPPMPPPPTHRLSPLPPLAGYKTIEPSQQASMGEMEHSKARRCRGPGSKAGVLPCMVHFAFCLSHHTRACTQTRAGGRATS